MRGLKFMKSEPQDQRFQYRRGPAAKPGNRYSTYIQQVGLRHHPSLLPKTIGSFQLARNMLAN